MTIERNAQKKRSRDKNDITTMQLTNELKKRLKRVKKFNKLAKREKLDEALDEALSFYEDNHPDILAISLESVDD